MQTTFGEIEVGSEFISLDELFFKSTNAKAMSQENGDNVYFDDDEAVETVEKNS